MGLADELWKLQEMHQRGELSDDEYAQAKAAVLAGTAPDEGGQLDQLSRQIDDVAQRRKPPTLTAPGTGNARITWPPAPAVAPIMRKAIMLVGRRIATFRHLAAASAWASSRPLPG